MGQSTGGLFPTKKRRRRKGRGKKNWTGKKISQKEEERTVMKVGHLSERGEKILAKASLARIEAGATLNPFQGARMQGKSKARESKI